MDSPVGGDKVISLSGLTKVFNEHVVAVDHLDLTISRGQIFGLLGPNGAGKTTTIRMLLGLVIPTSGSIEVFGQRLRPGADVLARVGAMVEDPSFVPHLSGIENLRQWWRYGGQPLREAHVEEALAVAGLGDDVFRKVRTYSHGMRQRLGIAQALLCNPDLLVLDEPTNGLDPAQIRELRQVFWRLSERGTTVMISSHLLAEVEQSCTHVGVMNRGKIVTAGAVDTLVGGSEVAYVEVDDAERARAVLAATAGVASVSPEGDGLSVALDGTDRPTVVASLVHAGVAVRTVTARHRLEDAFLQLLSSPTAQGPDDPGRGAYPQQTPGAAAGTTVAGS